MSQVQNYIDLFNDYFKLSSLPHLIYSDIQSCINKISLKENESLEIEMKFGEIQHKVTKTRLNVPIHSPTIISIGEENFFFSSISKADHKLVNTLLNNYFSECMEKGLSPQYSHDKSSDKFYQSDIGKIRASYSKSECLLTIRKTNLANFHIHYPNAKYDVRISINIEAILDHSFAKGCHEIYSRFKDRISYSFPNFAKVDLTMVSDASQSRSTFELEFEIESQLLGLVPIGGVLNMIDWLQINILE